MWGCSCIINLYFWLCALLYGVGGCGILPLLFTLFQNNLNALFCLKLNFLWWNSSNGMTVGYHSCYLWRMWAQSCSICCCTRTATFLIFPSRAKASVRCYHAASMGYAPTKGPCQPGTRTNRCLTMAYAGLHCYKPFSSPVTWELSYSFGKQLQYFKGLLPFWQKLQ